MTTVVISQPMLFPWVGMFEQVALADVFVHYDDVAFSKGSFTNRVQVKTSSGPSWMTVPLRRFALGTLIRDLEANEDTDWRAHHLALLAGTYREAPHHEAMLALVREEYGWSRSLTELLTGSLERVANLVGTGPTRFVRSSELNVGGSGWSRVLEVTRRLGGDVYVTGHGARHYLDAEAFEAAGIEVRYMDYACRPYPQLHGPFTPFVTVLDLLANAGPDAATALDPRTVDWRTFTG